MGLSGEQHTVKSMAILAMLSAAACVLAQPNGESFTPGHIFVSEFGVEGCIAKGGPLNWIREIDPETGESSIFADPSDGLCDNGGLIFTPDGKRLRVTNFSANNVMDFDPAGNGTIVYRDQGFGLRSARSMSLKYDASPSSRIRTVALFGSAGSAPATKIECAPLQLAAESNGSSSAKVSAAGGLLLREVDRQLGLVDALAMTA